MIPKQPKSNILIFLLENSDHLGLLKSLITFLPGRYGDSELFSEGLYSVANILQSYLDYRSSGILLSNNIDKISNGEKVPPPYYLTTLRWITTVQSLELFFEMLATKKGEQHDDSNSNNNNSNNNIKKMIIFIIELLKAILRLKLLIKTNGDMLVHHSFYVPSKDVKTILENNRNQQKQFQNKRPAVTMSINNNNNINNNDNNNINNNNNTNDDNFNNNNNNNNNRRTLSDQIFEQQRIVNQENNLLYQQQRELQQNESTLIKLLPPPPPKDYNTKTIGEILFIFRPVIYWVSYCIFGKKSWKPWFLSLVTELLSKSFSEYGNFKQKIRLTLLEAKELNRRKKLLFFYLIRSPFYEKFIGDGLLNKFLNFLKKIHIFKTLIDILINYLNVYRTRYFYTSAS
ncbi:peroxisomal biogenesis factor 16 [Dictyostelium discoideum AX4]|uniref:Peroxisome biogenesis factor 16 n=1 Tax=Dictyostelium discoideum TaxID=44689 RepID=PEX16_DICDI|nr:peroxisomal biogenesis factor 16 [Dictyostelium discoideum AX4]Q550G0.1 RecName: Full=Peroxisome biogenesis factor 16; AltName: Full=Peroxin-16 [Dictyostelium discoideum]EAL69058.2 peroxisomal biogenesis factor 16 [Dictyostelium discoideum AX4]|eukprot:XP_642972.2 peroxisomal biogenesis factor 16 [Dictyostelium discoideum AX4]